MSSNKLPQYVKEAIICSVTADIPKPDQEKLKSEIQAALVKGMSVPCRNLYKKKPEALKTVYLGFEHGLDRGSSFVCGDANDKDILQVFKDDRDNRKSVLQNLKSAINACTTRKQFVERFPELTSYLPSNDAACTTLPAVSNVVADLVKLGFVPKVAKS